MAAQTVADRVQFLHDVMITALEGGVGYWSVADHIERHPDDRLWYQSFVLYCSDGGIDPVECGHDESDGVCAGHRVTPDLVVRGLSKAVTAGPNEDIGWHYNRRSHVIVANRENEGGDIDADDADCIVQLGIFGRVIYG